MKRFDWELAHAVAFLVMTLALLVGGVIACTPQEQQIARTDLTNISASDLRCMAQQAAQQGVTVQLVESAAASCAIAEIPDGLRLLWDELQAARGKLSVDAGAHE